MIIANDLEALKVCNDPEDIFIIILWPINYILPDRLDKKVTDYITKEASLVYIKEMNLTKNGICNLIIQINEIRTIVGGGKNEIIELQKVWDNNGKCCFMIIQTFSNSISKIKGEIRNIYRLTPFAFELINNIRETRIVSNAIFNPNSVHFLNNASPNRYKKTYHLIESFKRLLEEKKCDMNNYIIDSSMVLAVYGIRPAADLDYLSIETQGDIIKSDRFEEHDSLQRSYYDNKIKELVVDPCNYFMFNELKFVSIGRLLNFKIRRYEDRHDFKDKNDILLIRMMLENNNNIFTKTRLLLSIWLGRKKLALKNNLKNILIFFQLYDLMHKSR